MHTRRWVGSMEDDYEEEEQQQQRRVSKSRRNRYDEDDPPPVNLNETFTMGSDGNRVYARHFTAKKSATTTTNLPSRKNDSSFLGERELQRAVEEAVENVSDRTFQQMLTEMRSKDRDRDRVLRPAHMHSIIIKYKIPILDLLDQLESKFEDKTYRGNVNYENLMQYLVETKGKKEMRVKEEEEQSAYVKPKRSEQVMERRVKESGAGASEQREIDSRASPFPDREDAMVILELEKSLLNSPNFDLNKFNRDLQSKDMYGNDQVSKLNVVHAASNANLNMSKSTLNLLLVASDTAKTGCFYSIPKLVSFMERSQPHLLERRSTS